METHLWTVVQAWRDNQEWPVSQSELGKQVGVTRSAMSQWKNGQSRPTPERLRELARATRLPYASLLDAVIRDLGYLNDQEEVGIGVRSAPKTQAGTVPAFRDSKANGFSEVSSDEVVEAPTQSHEDDGQE